MNKFFLPPRFQPRELSPPLLRRNKMSWLEGRGTGLRVPPYLRYDGQVKNLHIDAKMTGEMIADLLRAKEEGSQQETRLSDFLLQFTNLRYSTITLQMEFSYNLVDGLDRFKVSPGELREAIYFPFPVISTYCDVPRRFEPQYLWEGSDQTGQQSVPAEVPAGDDPGEDQLEASNKAGLDD